MNKISSICQTLREQLKIEIDFNRCKLQRYLISNIMQYYNQSSTLWIVGNPTGIIIPRIIQNVSLQ